MRCGISCLALRRSALKFLPCDVIRGMKCSPSDFWIVVLQRPYAYARGEPGNEANIMVLLVFHKVEGSVGWGCAL